ncbi:MAG: hypothetical protein ACYSSK_06970, partial [Planctomycetota bacterium]
EAGGRITGSANIAVRPETNQKVIVFGCYDNNLYCLDAETGKPIFEHPAESYINGSIAVANNAAFFGSCRGGEQRRILWFLRYKYLSGSDCRPKLC